MAKRREVVEKRTIYHTDQRLYDVPNVDYENRNGRVSIGGEMERINDEKAMHFQAYHEDGQLRIVGTPVNGLYLTVGDEITIIYEEDVE
ncbi:MAG: hypothetical protein JSS89_13105 [Bacteroidetes bacterium]|nr:hypothetical protein [Bacteroidota bacterium]